MDVYCISLIELFWCSDCFFFFVQNLWSATLYCLWLPCVTFQWLHLGSILWLSFFQVGVGCVLVLCYCALGLNKNRKDENPLALLCHLKRSMHATCLGSGGTVCSKREAISQNLFSSFSIFPPMSLPLLLKRIQVSWIKRPAYCWNKQVICVMGWTLPSTAGYLQCQQYECRLFSMCFAPHLQSWGLSCFQVRYSLFHYQVCCHVQWKSNSFIS